jgi:CRP-like cAMP-binding protein
VTALPSHIHNSVLSRLPAATLARLQPKLRHVQLKRHDLLQEAHRPIDRVYFLQQGVAVLLARTRRDGEVGVAIVGRFGLVGVPAVLGTMRSPHRCVMEVQGEALQIGAQELRRAMDESPLLRQQLLNYVQALLVQNAQSALCNARHNLEERLARWLLLTRDRLDDDAVPLTHDLLSMMLGVRRAGVTTALEQLERSGAVRRKRGAVEIANRARLEQSTCECYRIIATEHQRLIDFSVA